VSRENDVVRVYRRVDGTWDWHRHADNGDIISGSENQGYEDRERAVEMASELNPGVRLEIEDV